LQKGLDRFLVICPSGQFAATQMPEFDLPVSGKSAEPSAAGVKPADLPVEQPD